MPRPLTATPIERDIVLVSGDDASSYLQTQLSQDVESLPRGRTRWSFILTPRSEIEAIIRVTRTIDGLILDTEVGTGDTVRNRLDGPLFRMDVKFSQERWPGVAWRGEGAHDIVGDAPIVAPLPWEGVDALDEVGPDVEMPTDTPPLDQEELDAIRITERWPSDAEIDGKATPAMTGIVEHTVNFEKGCYTGQEFVARVHYRDATPPKRLVRVSFEPGGMPAPSASIEVDGDVVGTVTSIASGMGVALGYSKRSVPDGSEVMVDGLGAIVNQPIPDTGS